jgi:phytoene synthase
MSTVAQNHPLQLNTAYSVCNHIARNAARNFYYGFLVLPKARRNALSAVYSFMRHADDISDDPSRTPVDRRQRLAEYIASYHVVASGTPTDDPVFLALRDSQQKFDIPTELLDQLVAGTAMDLQPQAYVHAEGSTAPVVAYRTFEELYGYCYHVASVVGLVCIKVFGYTDRKAEEYAEQLGVAFQLTNILRDIKEDAAMGRVYLPQEDLDQFGVTPEMLASGADMERVRPLLVFEAQRARQYYTSAERLMPLIEDVSQPALWSLVTIYHGILDRIERKNYDVYTERVRLSTLQKVGVLARGMLKRLT